MGWITSWSVSVDGKNVSATMNDWLRSISITEREDGGGDTADLDLDDTGGALYLPRAGARVSIALGGVQKFDGWTEEPEWLFARGSGRVISVHCTAHDTRGAVKDAQRWHQDGGTLEDFLKRAAKRAGLASIKVSPALASIARSWWSPEGATFAALGRRLADEFGAVFRIRGDQAIFAERGAGASVSGASLPRVVFDCADDTIQSVRAHPFSGGRSRSKARAMRFDRATATWKTDEVEIEPVEGAPNSIVTRIYPEIDGTLARKKNEGRKNKAEQEKGGATVACDLRVAVAIGSPATLVNARPGVDGTYKVKAATHKLDHAGGGTSEFQLDKPGGSAGTDGRRKSSGSTAYSP